MSHDDFLEAKVVVLGSQGVGKTSLVSRFVQQTFSLSGRSTVGASFFTKKITVDDCNVKLQIWDTAGQERFRSMAPMYYRGANAAVLVYDITSEQSFLDVSSWVQELKKNVAEDLIIHIVGSKLDLSLKHRAVHPGLAAEYARTCNPPSFSPCSRKSVSSIEIGTASNTPYLPETVTLRRASVHHYRNQQALNDHHLQSHSLNGHSNSYSNYRNPTQVQSGWRSNPPSPVPESPTHRRAMSHASSCTLKSVSSSDSSSTIVATLSPSSNPASSPPPRPPPKRTQTISFPTSPPTPHFQFPVLPKTIFPTTASPESKKPGRICINTKRAKYEFSGPVTAPVFGERNTHSPSVTWSEVSSKDDEGVQALFTDLARRLVARKDEIEKTRKKGSMKIGSKGDVDEGTRNDRWDRTGKGAPCCGI